MSDTQHSSNQGQGTKLDLRSERDVEVFEAVSIQKRKNLAQTHGHKRFWADFLTDRILLIVLLSLGTVSVYKFEDPILRTGYVSLFSGTAGALVHKLRQPVHKDKD